MDLDKVEIVDCLNDLRELINANIFPENKDFWLDIIKQAREIPSRPPIYSEEKLDIMREYLEKNDDDSKTFYCESENMIEEKTALEDVAEGKDIELKKKSEMIRAVLNESEKIRIEESKNFHYPPKPSQKLEAAMRSLKNQLRILNNIDDICLGNEQRLRWYGYENQSALENLNLQVLESIDACEIALNIDDAHELLVPHMQNRASSNNLVNDILTSYESSFNYDALSPKNPTNKLDLFSNTYSFYDIHLDLIKVSESPPSSLGSFLQGQKLFSLAQVLDMYGHIIPKNKFVSRTQITNYAKNAIEKGTEMMNDKTAAIYLFYISKPSMHNFITHCLDSIENGHIQNENDIGIVFSLIAEHIEPADQSLTMKTVINTKFSNKSLCYFQEHIRAFLTHNFHKMGQLKNQPSLLKTIFKLHHHHFEKMKNLILKHKYFFSKIDLDMMMEKINYIS